MKKTEREKKEWVQNNRGEKGDFLFTLFETRFHTEEKVKTKTNI